MTKSRKRLKEEHHAKEQNALVEERLTSTNEAYTQGAFRYLRILTHSIGLMQFSYGIYYQWFNVNFPQNLEEEEGLTTRWGGKFKYLTFLDVILQAIYQFIALLNDVFGSNAICETRMAPTIRKLRDYVFAAWAFPIANNVCIVFWVIYAYDRELIFPKALDAIFPNWLNHIEHTNVAMLVILDMFTCCRQYPSPTAGVTGTIVFMVLYIIWMHIVHFYSGHWVYPLLEILTLPMRYLMLGALLGFTVCCYFLGAFLNNIIWSTELALLRLRFVRREQPAINVLTKKCK